MYPGPMRTDGSCLPAHHLVRYLEAGVKPAVWWWLQNSRGEDTAAADKILLGTQVAVIGNTQEQQDYTIALTNGGFITKIMRDGAIIDFDDDKTAVVKAGDVISLDAETTNSQGQGFRQWSALIGKLTLADKTREKPSYHHAGRESGASGELLCCGGSNTRQCFY